MKKIFVFALTAFLFGCAGTTKWEPTMNSMPHKNQALESKDLAECKDLAFQAAGYVKEDALRAAGIIKSKFKDVWVQKQGTRWVEVHPFE